MEHQSATYTHGHHASVLRSHSWRTAENSAAYLLPCLKPNMDVLDVGCGPGTITVDLASRVAQGKIIGIDMSEDVIDKARVAAREKGLRNCHFQTGDVEALAYPDNSFDVVHAHQVLQHVGNPIKALREMLRVAKPGGIVAARDAIYKTWVFYPEVDGMDDFVDLYQKVALSNGGDPNGGRQLHVWAREAGLDAKQITKTASTWCYSTPEEVSWWSGMWSERVVESEFAKHAIKGSFATKEELERLAGVWREWGGKEDAWFVMSHGEIICRV